MGAGRDSVAVQNRLGSEPPDISKPETAYPMSFGLTTDGDNEYAIVVFFIWIKSVGVSLRQYQVNLYPIIEDELVATPMSSFIVVEDGDNSEASKINLRCKRITRLVCKAVATRGVSVYELRDARVSYSDVSKLLPVGKSELTIKDGVKTFHARAADASERAKE